jgi:hypothetical protein
VRGLWASLLVLLLAGLLFPALAGAAWSAPIDVSGQFAYAPQVAIDADGDAVFTWVHSDGAHARIQARVLSAGGALSAVKTISVSGQDAFSPQVGIDADGDAVFTWGLYDGPSFRIEPRARSAAGPWSAVQELGDPGQNGSPQVAIDADGDAVFTWMGSDGTNSRIQSRTRSADGTLSAVKTLSENGRNAGSPQVAVDPGGDAVFTWNRVDRQGFFRVQTRTRPVGGPWSAVQDLSDPGRNAYAPDVAVDGEGDAVFTWTFYNGTDYLRQTRARSAAGTLSAVQDLSVPPDHNGFPSVVDVDADGDAVFTWSRQARARSRTGTLSPVQTLYKGRTASDPQVAVDADGDAVFTWTGFSDLGWIQARTRSANGALSKVKYLSDPGQHANSPQVAVNPDGDAVVTWTEVLPPGGLVQASTGP